VDRVGVKTEGGECTPPLTLLDKTGVALARIPPVEGESLLPLQEVYEQYSHAIQARALQPVIDPEARIEPG
jgi:hypothetical protein